jgi:hypothetical protein
MAVTKARSSKSMTKNQLTALLAENCRAYHFKSLLPVWLYWCLG